MGTEMSEEGWRERRGEKRFAAKADTVLVFLEDGLEFSGKVADLSFSGCRIGFLQVFPERIGDRVEVALRADRPELRFSGVVQRVEGNSIGVRFDKESAERGEELAVAIAELTALHERQAGSADGAETGWTESPLQKSPSAAAGQDVFHLQGIERRAHPRQKADLTAALYLLGDEKKINGQLMNLSLSGCRIYTEEAAPVASTRVEAAFYHLGLPFRVAGVVQTVYEPNQVGIHFLDVTERNLVRLKGLMEELREEDRERQSGEKSL